MTVAPRWLLSTTCLFLAFCFFGCEDKGGKRPISGAVTRQGNNLARGLIEFVPAVKGQPSTRRCSLIVDGQYHIPRKDGLLPGNYQVEIQEIVDASSAAGDGPSAPEGAPAEVAGKVPIKLKLDQPLTATVSPDGPNTFDFHFP